MASYADDLGEDPFPNTGLQGASHDQIDFRSKQFRQPVLQFDELEERRGALELHENVDIAPRALLVPHDGAEDTQGSDAVTLLEGGNSARSARSTSSSVKVLGSLFAAVSPMAPLW